MPPAGTTPATPGYADGLHANLAGQLASLSDDPQRQDWQEAASVPIYVCSSVGGSREQGLKRLGTWIDKFGAGSLETGDAPLVTVSASTAHVALVYSHLEDLGPQPEATAETFFRALVEHRHYGSIAASLHTLLLDAVEAFHTKTQPARGDALTAHLANQPREDARLQRRHVLRLGRAAPDPAKPVGLFGTLLQLEDDVCAYICRNDLRERIRSFVREALLRIAAREDVTRIVVNTHSNGTVIGYDTIRNLPGPALAKVDTLITAGSPLRKYAELFSWGYDVGNVHRVATWNNYLDPRDPVADPLGHAVGWSNEPNPATDFHHFAYQPVDAAEASPLDPIDVLVDNLTNSSGGGLQAHNYWDNQTEFVAALAKQLS
jgi:hypothetical protein